MPRRLRGSGPRFDTSGYQPTEDMLLKPIQIGGLGGMDKKTPLPMMSPQSYRLARDVNIRYNSWAARDGTSAVGAAAGSELIYAADVHLSDGAAYIVRWRVDGVDVLSAGVWTPATGASFIGLRQWPFAITGWNDRVLFTAGAGRVYELTFNPGFVITELTDSPAGVIHLATFAGRVLASIYGTAVAWTVKFDHTDWSGIGSGFEDLQSAAGGKPDQQCAVIPITDEIAYCVRSQSVWQIATTGDFDSPLAFSRILTHVGSQLPATVAAVKQGLVCVGMRGQVWLITPQGIEDISGGMVDDFDVAIDLQEMMSAAYDVKFDEYRVVIPSASLTSHRVLRYSFVHKAWTEDVYPFPIKSIAYTMIVTGMSIDELVGSTDALVGATDDLGTPVRNEGFMYAMKDTTRYVVKDEPTMTDTATKDLKWDGTRVATGFRMESGDIKTDFQRRQHFAELVMWYETNVGMTFTFEFSEDGGATWSALGSPVVVANPGRSKPVSVQQTRDRPHLQFAVSTAVAPVSRLIHFAAMVTEGARIVDAS